MKAFRLKQAIILGSIFLAGGICLAQKSNKISFTENKGQVCDQNYKPRTDVLFGGITGNMTFHLRKDGISYQLYRVDKWKEEEDKKTKEKRKLIDQQTIYRIDLSWVNVNKNITQVNDESIGGYDNFYLQQCPDGVLNVKSYKGVTLKNIYDGINVHYYEKKGELKHDYIVAPHANYKNIQLKVEGAQIKISKNGSLLLITPFGKVEEGAPIVFQNGKQLSAKWRVKNKNLSFEIENYNPNYELIIDPITRLWGTYYGGTGIDAGNSCATDIIGNVYLYGSTGSTTGTIIATSGSHQQTHAGSNETYLAKFSNNGVRLWGTYYGSSGSEFPEAVTTFSNNEVYITGSVISPPTGTAIATLGSHQPTYGGNLDAFLVKFDGAGLRLWGTFYGSSGDEEGLDVTTDVTGNIYLCGYSSSVGGTAIATAGAHQATFSGILDAFLVKFSPSGTRQWGTYYGGNSDDFAWSCITDATGNIYLGGFTNSTSTINISSPGSYQQNFNGAYDGFLAKFNSNGVRQWGTYFGGSGSDEIRSLSTDNSGNVYLIGVTTSTNSIATAGSHQQLFNGGSYDGMLAKFNTIGVIQWCTYYGGSGTEYAESCSVDNLSNVYISGITGSNSGTTIATPGSHQFVYGGGTWDGFLAQFNGNGVRQWGTYYGGTSTDYGYCSAIDLSGNIFLSGYSISTSGTVIATPGSHQPVIGGSGDAFLVKFSDCIPLAPVASVNSIVCAGSSLNFTATITGTATPTYSWTGPSSYTSGLQNPIITNASATNIGTYSLTINNGGCVETTTTNVSVVNPLPTITVNSGSICSGNSFTIVPNGASTYTIQGGNNVVYPSSNTSYTVVGASTAGCLSSNTATSNITINTTPTVSVNSGSICAGNSFTIVPNGANAYTIQGGNNIVNPTSSTNYTVIGTSSAGCLSFNTATSNVTVNGTPTITVNSGSVCSGNSFTIVPAGANTYTIQGGNNVVAPSSNTSYTVVGISTAGCLSSNTATSIVVVNPNPTVTAVSNQTSFICVGQSATLTANGANTYLWNTAATTSAIVVSPTTTTNYTVTGTDGNGCSSIAVISQSVSACTGMGNLNSDKAQFIIYPNPVNELLFIETTTQASYELIDATGRIIKAGGLTDGKNQLLFTDLSKGIYLMKITSNQNQVKHIKLIKSN